MKALNYWQHFTETGDPKDYLSYKEKERNVQGNTTERAEEHAGNSKSNGNCTNDGAYRGF